MAKTSFDRARIAIRPARAGDLKAILRLWKSAGIRSSVSDEIRSLRIRLRRDRELFLVATDGPRLIGTLIAGWDGWRGTMARLAVAPRYRRHGVARRLLTAAEQELHKAGARRIGALIFTDNTLGRRFWRAAGYRLERNIRRFVKDLSRE